MLHCATQGVTVNAVCLPTATADKHRRYYWLLKAAGADEGFARAAAQKRRTCKGLGE